MANRDDGVASRILNDHVRRPYADVQYAEEWRNLPEIPTKRELLLEKVNEIVDDESWNTYQDEPLYSANLPVNIVDGPWPSTMDYLGAHYQLLREDSIASLRASIEEFRANPRMQDSRDTRVYSDVHIKGFQLAAIGAAFRVEFLPQSVHQIRWEQSKRLVQGTLVALSPDNDGFGSICKVAVVAARPVEGGLDQNPPQLDLFWGDINDIELDPSISYIMIEAHTGYFEASRHMLVAMQKLPLERFNLAKHLVSLDNIIPPPKYLETQPYLNLSSLIKTEIDPETERVIPSAEKESLENINVLEGFPNVRNSGMDESQIGACKRMLTSQLAIVQGPPGTGKTFTSVSAIKVLVENLGPDDPPIIIAAQTNHAVDQLMNHIMEFEENVVRIGGRSAKKNVEIRKRTLYELRISNPEFSSRGGRGLRVQNLALERKIVEIQEALAPLLSSELLTDDLLLKYNVITAEQKESLYEDGWGDSEGNNGPQFQGIAEWLGTSQIVPIPRTPILNNGLPLEELDLEYEQQLDRDLEGDEGGPNDDDKDVLRGTWVPYRRSLTGKKSSNWDDRKIQKLLAKSPDLFSIPAGNRGTVYRYFERVINRIMLQKMKTLLREYKATVQTTIIAKWELAVNLMRHLGIKVIGCTTTGLAKYRGMLSALQPRTLLVEEAAETLEANVISGMFDSLEHLILVGDHQQLQASCNIQALGLAPYNLSVSMFERLVKNSTGFTMLNRQRRMIREVRELLCIQPQPFYENLHDHPSVLDREINRPPVPGMSNDTYFFHHQWPEARNEDLSMYNIDEAQMIVGLFNHLVLNGVKTESITILTFYNGQRKAILKELKRHPTLAGNVYFNVFTVDSYQGEENDIILLSLVRSNTNLNIGFLESKNRLVVALSRARRGLYVFGNAVTLAAGEATEDGIGRDALWNPLLCHMRDERTLDVHNGFPIVCERHGTKLFIEDADHFRRLAGGCEVKCLDSLPCGHKCPYTCHAFEHERIACPAPCTKILSCSHNCSSTCGSHCKCAKCQGELEDWELSTQSSGQVLTENQLQPHTPSKKPKSWKPSVVSSSSDVSPKTIPGSIKKWKDYDAKKHDHELANNRAKAEASQPMVDPSKQVFNEVYLSTTVEDGIRVKGPTFKRVISTGRGAVPGLDQVTPPRKVSFVVAEQTGPASSRSALKASKTGQTHINPSHKPNNKPTARVSDENLIDLKDFAPSNEARTASGDLIDGVDEAMYNLNVDVMSLTTWPDSNFSQGFPNFQDPSEEEEDLITF